jgi:hypothetical protein
VALKMRLEFRYLLLSTDTTKLFGLERFRQNDEFKPVVFEQQPSE